MERHTFLAVPIPEDIQRIIHDYAKKIQNQIPLKKWTSMGDYHITLHFFGATLERNEEQLIQEIKNLQIPSFNLSINASGYFGNPKTPRVYWVSVNSTKKLDTLYEVTKKSCIDAGFDVSTRPFRPHITLGKRWGGDDRGIPLENIPVPSELRGISWEIDEIILYEIHPECEKKYVPLYRFPLDEGTN